MRFLRKIGLVLKKEVSFIMNCSVEFYDRHVPELHRNNVKIQMIEIQNVCLRATYMRHFARRKTRGSIQA